MGEEGFMEEGGEEGVREGGSEGVREGVREGGKEVAAGGMRSFVSCDKCQKPRCKPEMIHICFTFSKMLYGMGSSRGGMPFSPRRMVAGLSGRAWPQRGLASDTIG
jgi:hypothetical protein